jgi:hypothetical protein
MRADHSGLAVYGMNSLPRSNTGVVVSNPTQGMDICVCVVLCVGSDHAAESY